MVIIIENGDLFYGTREQFEDSFFSNGENEVIQGWCDERGWDVKFVEQIDLKQGQTAKHNWDGIYFHGQIQQKVSENEPDFVQDDLVGSDDLEFPIIGVSPCMVYGNACYAYIWKSHRGLVVLESDEKAKEYAELCHEEERKSL